MTERAISSQSENPASEPLENQGLQEPKTDITKVAPHWEEVNPATWKLTDGSGTNTPASYGKWPAFRTTKAIAWVIGISNGRWLVRYRDKASRLMKLPAARKHALEMVKGVRPGIILDDPVSHLNKITAGVMNACDGWRAPPIEPELLDYICEVETGGLLNEPTPTPPNPHNPAGNLARSHSQFTHSAGAQMSESGKHNAQRTEKLRCLKYGSVIRLCRGHFPKGVFPDDLMGRAHLFELVCVASLAPACADKKVEHLIGLWAPWMPEQEVADLKKHLSCLTVTERWHSPRDIGRILYCTNAEREAWALWQILPCDMTDEQLAAFRTDKRRKQLEKRRRSKGIKSKVEYLAELASRPKPWEAEASTAERGRGGGPQRRKVCLQSCRKVCLR